MFAGMFHLFLLIYSVNEFYPSNVQCLCGCPNGENLPTHLLQDNHNSKSTATLGSVIHALSLLHFLQHCPSCNLYAFLFISKTYQPPLLYLYLRLPYITAQSHLETNPTNLMCVYRHYGTFGMVYNLVGLYGGALCKTAHLERIRKKIII